MSDETNELEAQLIDVLKTQAAEFVKGSGADGIALGEEAVRAIFAQEVALVAIPLLPADASLETRAALEEILEARDRSFQLVASAERAEAERIERIRAQAAQVAGKIALTGGAILGTAALKALVAK